MMSVRDSTIEDVKAPATAQTAPGCGRTIEEFDMGKPNCCVPGCERRARTRQWCNMHYQRGRKDGTITNLRRMGNEERFWSKVDRSGTCWKWTAGVDSHGYGQIGIDGRHVLVHRYSYTLRHGEAPPELDHICHVRCCVNPDHLRPVTRKQNVENISGPRSDSKSGVRGVFRVGHQWRAQVNHDGRRHHVGYFDSIEEAEEAVIAKRIELFTHNEIDRAS